MTELQLSNGYVSLVDEADLPKVQRWHWHARYCNPDFYACRTTSIRKNGVRTVASIYLHRFLLNAPPELQVDHKNHDTLDNRRQNLELVTPEENSRRRR